MSVLKYGLSQKASDALEAMGVSADQIVQTIGNAAASAGTHAQDGTDSSGHAYCAAVDLSVHHPKAMSQDEIRVFLELLAHQGFAAFYRNPGHDHWPAGDAEHIHAVYAGLPMKEVLRNQVHDWLIGNNGLMSHAPYLFWQADQAGKDSVRGLYEGKAPTQPVEASAPPSSPEVSANFNTALKVILAHEGGYSDTAGDAGGPTNLGITQADLAAFRGHAVSADDVKNLGHDEAAAIFHKTYWTPLGLDGITNGLTATLIMDQGVLRGIGRVAIDLKQIFGNSDSGLMPSSLIAQLNGCDQTHLAIRLLLASQKHYIQIALNNANDVQFLNGWLNRVDSDFYVFFGMTQ